MGTMDFDNGQNPLGKQIQDSVQAAVSSINHMVGDIQNASNGVRHETSQLGIEVNASVRRAVEEIRNQVFENYQLQQAVRRQAQQSQQQIYRQRQSQLHSTQQVRTRTRTRKAKKFPGEAAANAWTVICGALTGIWTFGMLGCLLDLPWNSSDVAGFIFIFLFFVGSLLGVTLSVRKKRQFKRFRQYISRFSTQPQISVLEIQAALGYSRKTVLKDFREMIRLGVFPQGHISPDNSMVFLSNEAFMKYQQQYMIGAVTPKAQVMPSNASSEQANGMSSEVQIALEQGRAYILQIRNANDALPGEVISQKLDTLEDVCNRIFKVVERYPDKLGEIRKFMDYYMPTTLKLVKTYREFEEQKLDGEKIRQTKQDIEDTLDMINIAFQNLLNELFQDAAVEANADISVLNALFAQEGLKEKEFTLQ